MALGAMAATLLVGTLRLEARKLEGGRDGKGKWEAPGPTNRLDGVSPSLRAQPGLHHRTLSACPPPTQTPHTHHSGQVAPVAQLTCPSSSLRHPCSAPHTHARVRLG